MTTCGRCGRTTPDDAVPLSWSTAVERARRVFYCEICSRTHLRAMEGRLDPEHW